MNSKLFLILLISALFLITEPINAQERVPVQIDHSGKDRVGYMLANLLEHQVENSKILRKFEENERGLRVIILSMPYTKENEDVNSIYSVAWCFDLLGDNAKILYIFLARLVIVVA